MDFFTGVITMYLLTGLIIVFSFIRSTFLEEVKAEWDTKIYESHGEYPPTWLYPVVMTGFCIFITLGWAMILTYLTISKQINIKAKVD